MPELFNENQLPDNRLIFCGLLVFISAACYLQVMGFGFLIIDDSIYVTANEQVRQGLTLETFKWAFTTIEAEFWHPLTWLSLLLDSTLYGLLPRGFHSTSLLLHIGAVVFLFLGFDLMSGKRGRSFVLAAIFAVHPLHVETVAWIAERKEIMCGFFWCTAIYAYALYVRKPSLNRYLAVLVLFCLGLMSKPMIVTFPFLLLLLDYWPLNRPLIRNGRFVSIPEKADIRRWINLVTEKIPFFILTGLGIGVAIYAQGAGEGLVGLDIYPFRDRVDNAIVSYVSYLIKTFLPFNLSIFYPFRMDLSVVKIVGSGLILLILTVIVLSRMKKQPYLFTGWFWFLGTLVPVIGIVKIGDFAMADRYMYIPIAGILIAVIWVCADFLNRILIPKACIVILAAGLILFGATGTWIYLGKWENSETLFQHAAISSAPNYFAHFALGHVYAGKGRYSLAEQEFEKAVSFRHDKSKLRIDLGRAIGSQGRFADAIPHFSSVLEKKKNNAEAHFYIGVALTGTEQLPLALAHFSMALTDQQNANTKSIDELKYRIAEFGLRGQFEQALKLLEINISESSLKNLFVNGFSRWQNERHQK